MEPQQFGFRRRNDNIKRSPRRSCSSYCRTYETAGDDKACFTSLLLLSLIKVLFDPLPFFSTFEKAVRRIAISR